MIEQLGRNERMNLTQGDVNSSGTTQRKASLAYDSAITSKQQLPIISTRRVHLAID